MSFIWESKGHPFCVYRKSKQHKKWKTKGAKEDLS
jgi:hypothetical protein